MTAPAAPVVATPKVLDITVPKGAVQYQWRCGICGDRRWEPSYLAAALDAIDHLNDAHARTLVGDGR